MNSSFDEEEEMMYESESDQEEEDHDMLVPPPSCWFEEQQDEVVNEIKTSVKSNGPNRTKIQQLHPHEPDPVVTLGDEIVIRPSPHLTSTTISAVGVPQKAPSWREISCQVLPTAAKELLSTSMRRIIHTARLSYAKGRWTRQYTDLGAASGYFRSDLNLPQFSNLPWVDRQLVREWRTIGDVGDNDDADFEHARTFVPVTVEKPKWKKSDLCQTCRKPFGPTLLRHHCRLCGGSFCHAHSNQVHSLPHLGYDPQVPERVCLGCKQALNEQTLAERVAWRMARCRDYFDGDLTPYFETGVDTVEEAAIRITKAAITMARSIPLGAQAHVAVETVDVLRKYGLKGIYGLILRKEFLAAADLLCRACDINQKTFPLSVHELSAAIFYALAQHRAIRGMNPEREHLIHSFRVSDDEISHPETLSTWTSENHDGTPQIHAVIDETDVYDPKCHGVNDLIAMADAAIHAEKGNPSLSAPVEKIVTDTPVDLPFRPVCDPVPDGVLASCLFYAPIALNFIYAERDVDMQLLAAQQGWRLLYSHLEQDAAVDRPGSAIFVHEEQKILCFAVRGTSTVNDVVTDVRQMPIPFPESANDNPIEADGWTPVFKGQGLSVCGMAKAAVNLFHEHIDIISLFAEKGYRIRVVGHSLGAGVATLLGTLVVRHLEENAKADESSSLDTSTRTSKAGLVRVYGFGPPSCVDAILSDYVKSFVTTVVLHDDVIPRLSPTSIRGLVKHLLHIRETWVQLHLHSDLMAITERARTVWAPRWRNGFTLKNASGYCRKQLQYGKRKLLSVQGKMARTVSSPLEDDTAIGVEEASRDEGSCSFDTFSSEACDEREVQVNDGIESLKLIVEFIGGMEIGADGTVIDGDEFFDTEDGLVEGDDEDEPENFLETETEFEAKTAAIESTQNDALVTNDSFSKDESSSSFVCDVELEEVDDPSSAVMLDETPLPRMFLPGKVIHMYTHRGGYKAAFVPRTFRELRRISTAGNMLSDHTCKSYYEALLEVRSVRNAQEGLPRWTAFDEDDTCSCCASRFTWASTSDSEAQEARDKHNCRSCGTLCCDPCSTNRIPLPTIGLTVAVRVCDRCYNDMGGPVDKLGRTSSFTEEDIKNAEKHSASQPERTRERRSMVVDELTVAVHNITTVAVHN